MFDRKTAHRKSPPSRRLVRVAGFLAVGSGCALAVAGWFAHGELPACAELLDGVEQEVKSRLVRIAGVPATEAATELAAADRELGRASARLRRFADRADSGALTDAELTRFDEVQSGVERLRKSVGVWRERVRAAGPVVREEVWIAVLVESLAERRRWPLGGIVSRPVVPAPRLLWRDLRGGFAAGSLWPVHAFLRAGRPSSQGIVRRALFPHGRNDVFPPLRLLGFGMATIAVGYALCWVGMRWNRAWASHLGLVYFTYGIIFATCLISLHTGVLE